ncbi:uncharacterized protein [Rutidosis leptorrhynchoides]|uniref:uncharacterized protein n=1 Tax=Rutidosis leptorrhynchoides TaxID=125765 RepID=UPI003A98D151
MEGLHLMIRDDVKFGQIRGANIGSPSINGSHIFYADDTSEWHKDSLINTLNLFNEHYAFSGLRANGPKRAAMSSDGNPVFSSSTESSQNPQNNDISNQLVDFLKISLLTQPKLSDSLKINLSLSSQNYALWSRIIKVAIGRKSKILLNHLTSSPPESDDPSFEKWEQDDLVVFSWLIQNIEPNLASNLTEFPTAKTLWDALVTTYSSGKDKLQNFEANDIKQENMSLSYL